jgi:hypothetical protein
MQMQGSEITERGADTVRRDAEPLVPTASDRMRELEAENARLKSLIGELLVTNQLLREDRKSIKK